MALRDRAGPVEENPLLRDHADLGDMLAADGAQDRENLSLADQARAAAGQAADPPLVNFPCVAVAAKGRCRKEAAEGSTDDPDASLDHDQAPVDDAWRV